MKVLLVGDFTFPRGSAAAIRIKALSQGLINAGAHVEILTCGELIDNKSKNELSDYYSWCGLRYRGTRKQRKKVPVNRINNILVTINSYLKLWLLLYKSLIKTDHSVILVYGRKFLLNSPILLMAKMFKKHIFFEVCEWFPAGHYKGGWLGPSFWSEFATRHILVPRSTGVVAISSYIANKYEKKGTPYIIVPSILPNCGNVRSLQKENYEGKSGVFNVMYAGKCKAEDGFWELCEGIKLASVNGCPVYLRVIGVDGKSGTSKAYSEKCANDPVLKNRVDFLGWVPDQDYHAVLSKMDCLVIPRLDIPSNKASFPTRLPEFLSTGIPVLTTRVGDIPSYLENGFDALIVNPDRNGISEGIYELWKYPEKAATIGANGTQTVNFKFNTFEKATELFHFMENTH